MKVTDTFSITKRCKDLAYYGEYNGKPYVVEVSCLAYRTFDEFYNTIRTTPFKERSEVFEKLISSGHYQEILNTLGETNKEVVVEKKELSAGERKAIMVNALNRLINFFTEFNFTPSFRFVNTFSYLACKSDTEAATYVQNYFALMDSSYVNEVVQKVTSAEFNKIIRDIAQYGEPKEHINTRLKIYYGNAGTGKTTIAQDEADNRCIVCNSSMLPSDLMEDFIFKEGNPDFNPSLLWDCMEQGKTIVLDEINLLPFDSLRFLQGIVDGKKEFYYKNRPVHIHEGFQIIGTMNLSLGGMVYGLPEPLVDRCMTMKEFKLTAEQLSKAIIGIEE